MTAAPPSLTYASAPVPWFRQRSFRRGILIAILIAVSIGSWRVWHAAPGQWARANYYYWVCAHHTDPPDKIIYAYNDSEAQAEILRNGGQRDANDSAEAFIYSRPLNNFEQISSPCLVDTTFLHERQAPSGERRLVDVELCHIINNPLDLQVGAAYELSARIYSSPGDGLRPMNQQRDIGSFILFAETANLRLYAGQPDPNDPARFTIRYSSGKQSGMIEGRLQNGCTVNMKILSGPAGLEHLLRTSG